MSFAEEWVSLTPVNFFQMSVDCTRIPPAQRDKLSRKEYQLPSLSSLCGEEAFADLFMGWHEEGLEWVVDVHHPIRQVRYPSVELGDSVELFIDTRDVKSSGFNTRFCHHFFFLPESVDGHAAGEITRFRTEDTHPLCDPQELKLSCSNKRSGYQMRITIPSSCLHGYDPVQFNRLGFSYRINRADGFPQHFAVVTDDFSIEQQPSLWASIKLIADT